MMRLATTVLLFILLGAGLPAAHAQSQSQSPATQKGNPDTGKTAPDRKTLPSPPASADEQTTKHSNAVDNPFPEEESKSAAKAVERGDAPPLPANLAGDSSTTAGQGSGTNAGAQDALPAEDGVSSSRTRLEGLDDAADPDTLRKSKAQDQDSLRNPKRAAEDVAIGKMYLQSQNFRGAYMRYKEALTLNPEDAEAAFGVAETARRLNQPEEAVDNYKLCIDLDPDGPRAKAARKALAVLSPSTAR